MDYKEYKKAADRHLFTCQKLMHILPVTPVHRRKELLLNAYYLSGYVIESALSYAFFSQIRHKGPVEDNEDYRNGFKSHSFDTKIHYIQKSRGDLSSLPFITIQPANMALRLLFRRWSTDFRYCYSDHVKNEQITEEILRAYLIQIEQFLIIILKRY